MGVRTLKGSKIFIGPVVADTVDTVEEFEGLTYTAIGFVEDFGELGDESPIVKFTAVEQGRVLNNKGARDAGTQTVIVGHDPLNAGQLAAQAACDTDFEYAIKIELNDNPSPSYTKTLIYYRGIVSSKKIRMGVADNVVREVYACGINNAPIIVPAELI